MSSKENAVAELKSAGYMAGLENGVVMVYLRNKEDYESLKDEVTVFLKEEVGYGQSFGIRAGERFHETHGA